MGLSRKHTQRLAYIAGIFDGEGTVGAYFVRDKRDVTLQVAIAMCDPTVVAFICKEFSGARFTLRDKRNIPNATPQHVVTFHGLQAYEFLKAIKPYTIIKWEQVKVALAFLAHKRRTKNSKKHYPCVYCDKVVAVLRDLKTQRLNAVKTVELLRLHGLRQYRAKPEEVEQDCQEILALMNNLQESVETRLSLSTGNKAISAAEQDIVQPAIMH